MKFQESSALSAGSVRPEIVNNQSRQFSLAEAISSVLKNGVYLHQFDAEAMDKISDALPTPSCIYEKDLIDWQLEQGKYFAGNDLARFWHVLEPDSRDIRICAARMNYYRPGDFMPKHLDTQPGPSGMLEVGGEDGLIESALTFLYVVEGGKVFKVYTDGPNEDPIEIDQEPGLLMVFPIADVADYRGQLLIPGLYHEVPEQDVYCKTFTWEVTRFFGRGY